MNRNRRNGSTQVHLAPPLFVARIAVRNLWRHSRRSLSAIAAVAFGVVSLLLASGFIESILLGMREATITSRLGHIQVEPARSIDARAADPLRNLLPDDAPSLESIRDHPAVQTVGKRIQFSGLMSVGERTISFIGEGVEPEPEVLLSAGLQIVRGESLSSADPRGMILGAGLAANLDVDVGDPIVLMANTSSGGLNGVEGHVRGIFTTVSKAYDDAALRMPMVTARSLLRISGSHQWVVLLNRTESTAAVVEALRGPESGQKLDFFPWYELADMYNKTERLFRRQVDVLRFIVAVIIVLSISNTMTMVVMERTGEIGTAMALGVRKFGVLRMFLAEGLLLGLVGGAIGLAVGIVLAAWISHFGIPMPPPPGMARGYTAHVIVTSSLAGNSLALSLVTAMLATAYPAWKASRIAIVDALRHNR